MNIALQTATAQTVAEEYHLKASFIYNFTKFFEWESYDDSTFTIGIVGISDLHKPLTKIAKAKTVNGKKIIIRQFENEKDIKFCNIIFVSNNLNVSIEEILKKASAKGTLIVCEKPGAGALGSCINFVIVNKKLKFEINTKAMEAAGFKASSQLLKLAIIVD